TRAYAQEQLARAGETDAVERRHAEFLRDLLARAEKTQARGWIDDVSPALEWAFSPRGDSAVGVALTLEAIPLWIELSRLQECRRRVEQAIASLDRQSGAGGRAEVRLLIALATAM